MDPYAARPEPFQENEGWVHVTIGNNLYAKMPYTPYEGQLQIMTKITECLENGRNLLIDSPTVKLKILIP